MKRKLLSAALAASLVATTFAFTAQPVKADDTVTLVMAEENSADSLSGKVAQHFADKVAELTDGSVVIDLQCSKVLGSETEILDGMISMAGTVDIERVTSSRFTNYDCDKAAVLGLPYLFDSRDHFWAAVSDETIQNEIFEDISKLGITGLGFYEEGFRNFFFKEEVTDYTDIAGKKIRVSEDPIMQGIVEGLGGSPTVISSGEIYTSLQSGVIDGAEQPLSPYETNAFNEVASYMLLDQHTLGNAIYIISDMGKAKLTDEQFAAVQEAFKDTMAYNQEISAQTDEDCMASLTEKGVTFIEVEDKQPYKDAVTAVTDEYTADCADFYQSIVDMAQ